MWCSAPWGLARRKSAYGPLSVVGFISSMPFEPSPSRKTAISKPMCGAATRVVLATKPATGVSTDVALIVRSDTADPSYVSRGGHKLAGALAAFAPLGLSVAGRSALDAGASTGGFTDVLLREGASHVTAVDVGYGQLAWPLRQHSDVTVLDRTNVRDLQRGMLP